MSPTRSEPIYERTNRFRAVRDRQRRLRTRLALLAGLYLAMTLLFAMVLSW